MPPLGFGFESLHSKKNAVDSNGYVKSILKVSRFYQSDWAVNVTHMFGQFFTRYKSVDTLAKQAYQYAAISM